MFWQNEEYSSSLGAEIRLDGVVCVVDAMFALKVSIGQCTVLHVLIADVANGG
jgi:hypothetical protein